MHGKEGVTKFLQLSMEMPEVKMTQNISRHMLQLFNNVDSQKAYILLQKLRQGQKTKLVGKRA